VDGISGLRFGSFLRGLVRAPRILRPGRVMVSSGSNVSTFGVGLCEATGRCCASTVRFRVFPRGRHSEPNLTAVPPATGSHDWFARIGREARSRSHQESARCMEAHRETRGQPSVECDSQAACQGARCGSGEVEDCMGSCSRSDHGDRSDTNTGDHSPRATLTGDRCETTGAPSSPFGPNEKRMSEGFPAAPRLERSATSSFVSAEGVGSSPGRLRKPSQGSCSSMAKRACGNARRAIRERPRFTTA
jgi:hypothetical protein